MKYLVSGSTGIVGRYIVRELVENCVKHNVDQVVSLSRKNRYPYEDHPDKASALLLDCYGDLLLGCVRTITQYKPDVVIHCAGLGTQNAPAKDLWKSNVDTTFNLLEACSKLTTRVKFLYCSSIAINNTLLNLYGCSKLASEYLIRSYCDMNENIQGSVCRFPAVAGAGNKHGVVKDVVAKLMDRSTPFRMNLFGSNPGSIKPFVYAPQLTSNIIYILKEQTLPYRLWDICPSDNISVKKIAEIAMQETGYKKEIQWQQNVNWRGDQQVVYPTNSDIAMYDSKTAIELSIKDILQEDYGYAV